MNKTREHFLNDHIFMEGLRCPLKLKMMNQVSDASFHHDGYRQRNKLYLRDAVAQRFNNVKHTPDDTEDARATTEEWLQSEDEITICGAVVHHHSALTRIPILRKKGEQLTLIQVHGKLRNESPNRLEKKNKKTRHHKDYLIRAAFRREVVKRAYPGSEIQILFYHPLRNYVSGTENLHRFKAMKEVEKVRGEFMNLFTEFNVTEEVKAESESLSGPFVHTLFEGIPVTKAIAKIESLMWKKSVLSEFGPHTGCSYCTFRKRSGENPGCWELHFTDSSLKKPDLHLYELIGHGNQREASHMEIFQEQVTLHDAPGSFEAIRNCGTGNITIQQRRTLQILSAKDKEVPLLWVRKELAGLHTIAKPIHFIDFEAATFAIPLRKQMSPYQPLFYQFSCHTMDDDGGIRHTEWLDLDFDESDIHKSFIRELARIPEIEAGTIVHYSPFERQAIHQLLNEFGSRAEGEDEVSFLNRFLKKGSKEESYRFLDLNPWVRDYYYNRLMKNGLSLKEVLRAVLRYEQLTQQEEKTASDRFSGSVDPYSVIQKEKSAIQDGSSAMNAWISFKCGLLTPQELSYIPDIMKKYCELDSLALLHVAEHLMRLGERIAGGEQEGDIVERDNDGMNREPF